MASPAGGAAAAPGGARQLSTEFMPNPEGTVYGLAAIDEDTIVSGDDTSACIVWSRLPGGQKHFGPAAILSEHGGSVRAITPIRAGAPGFPTGGFATGCMDKTVRLFSLARSAESGQLGAKLERTLVGHTGGVIHLGWTAAGQLLSGGWDGAAKVWDLATGACVASLEGHENGTSVCGLPNGDIAVGSTGRKNEANQHVDYKIRIWRAGAAAPGAPASAGGYGVARVLSDHDQAVRSLALLPDGRFVSAGNDGAVKLRSVDGSVSLSFCNPMGDEGKPFSAFCVHATAGGDVVAGNEDQTIRIYAPDGTVTTLPLPGTPWGVASLPESGDVVVGCGQAGTSRKGHVYVFSARPDRAADEYHTLQYTADCAPPAAAAGGAGGGGAGGAGGGAGGEKIKISGAYEARSAYPGKRDGQYGFFKRGTDGAVMVCSWAADVGEWLDIGEMDSAAAGANGMAEDDDAGAVGPDGKPWDYACPVTLDTSSGMRSMTLRFNEGEDAMDVALRFCEENGIPMDSAGQISEFVQARKQERGGRGKRVRSIPTFTHFPARVYVELFTIDFSKVRPKLLEFNAAVAASGDATVAALAMSEPEADAWEKGVISVLEQTTRYHSSKVGRPGLRLLASKLMRWPAAQLLPVADVLRMAVLHADAVDGLCEVFGSGDALLSAVLGRLGAAAADPAQRGVALTLARCLFNCFRHGPLREAAMRCASTAGPLLPALGALFAHEHATVKAAAAALLLNLSVSLVETRRARIIYESSSVTSGSVGAAGVPDVDMEVVQATAAAAISAASRVAEEEPLYRVLVALGTLVAIDPAIAVFAKGNGADAALAAAAAAQPASAAIKEVSEELRAAVSSASA